MLPMILLVSGGETHVGALAHTGHLGILLTPIAGNAVSTTVKLGLPWAADNAAFSGFNEPAYLRFLERVAPHGPLWVTAPDVVGRAAETLDLFDVWEGRLTAAGVRKALVAQDGLEDLDVPWDRIDCLFIGGSTDWKISEAAYGLVREAKRRGKWVHIGRVNTRRRMHMAIDWGVDSVDGTAFSRYPSIKIPRAIDWIEERNAFNEANRRLF